MWKLFVLILFPLACFSATARSFLEKLDINRKDEIQASIEHLLISTEMGYVLYGDKPVCMLAIFNEYPLPHFSCQNFKTSIFLKKFSEFVREIDFGFQGNYIVKNSDVKQSGLDQEVLFISRSNFLQVVNENIYLFQYILGPDVTAESLLKQLLEPNETLFSVLKHNFALVGIVLGYGTQNSLFFNRSFVLQSSRESVDNTPLRRKEKCLGATGERPNYPGFGHSSLSEELQSLQSRMLPSRGLEKGAYPPLVIFAYVENEESKKIISGFKVARNKIHQALQGNYLEEILSALSDHFPDPGQLSKPVSQKIDPRQLLQALSYKFNKLCKSDPEHYDQTWKDSFFEGLQSGVFPLLPEKSMQLHRGEYQAKRAFLGSQNLKKTKAIFETLKNRPDLTCLVPEKLYFKVVREGKKSGELNENMKVSMIYQFEDFSSYTSSGYYEKIAINDFVAGVAIGIQGMKVGEVRDLWVHPDYIYGDQGDEPQLGFTIRLEICDAENSNEKAIPPEIYSCSSASEDVLSRDYIELKRQVAFDYGCDVGALLGQGINLAQVSEALKKESEVPPAQSDEMLGQFYATLLAKQYEKESSEALKFFSTRSHSAKCIYKDRLYLDLVEEGKGSRIEKDGMVKIRRIIKNRLGSVLSDAVSSIDLKNTIKGYEHGFIGQKVGSKIKLYIHPDWAYKGFSAFYGDAFLATEAEILSVD